MPPSPAPVVIESHSQIVSSTTAVVSIGAATDTDVLVVMLVSQTNVPALDFQSITIDGDASRNSLQFYETIGQTECHARVYPLETGDTSIVVTLITPLVPALLVVAVVNDSSMIPTDWVLNKNTAAAASTPRTATWTADDSGIIFGAAVILDSVLIITPYDWTDLGSLQSTPISTSVGYGTVTAAGSQTADIFTGTIPALRTGDVYWFGITRIGLRIRDGGGWIVGGNVVVPTPGPAEPVARQFPPDPDIPNLPPPPTEIVVPTRPWIPKTGQFQPGAPDQ